VAVFAPHDPGSPAVRSDNQGLYHTYNFIVIELSLRFERLLRYIRDWQRQQ
jgi:hypothetical protein